jgi:hypothetical protein
VLLITPRLAFVAERSTRRHSESTTCRSTNESDVRCLIKRFVGVRHFVFSLTLACGAAAAGAQLPTPPRLTGPVPKLSANEVYGEETVLDDRGVKFTLFLPKGWINNGTTNVAITTHFHTVASSAISSHVRRGSRDPLIVFALGSGSSAYRAPFEDTNRFARVLGSVEEQLKRRGLNAHVTTVDISSFSAGYGAVRELMKSPHYFSLIRRVILLDSIYGGIAPVAVGRTNRVVESAHVDVWVPLANAAMRKQKTFVITLSEVQPATFASTREVTSALLDCVGLKLSPVSPANTNSIALVARADVGNFHVWQYSGTNAAAHMAHVHHMAEVWRAIE